MIVLKDQMFTCTRSRPRCDQCMKPIAKGEKYRYQLSKDGGDLLVYTAHIECDAAANEFNDMAGTWADDNNYQLCDLEPGNYEWLLEGHPIVAGRMNIQGPVDIRRLNLEQLMDHRVTRQ